MGQHLRPATGPRDDGWGLGPTVLIGLPASLGAAVMFGVGAILLAVGVRQVPAFDHFDIHLLFAVFRQPAFLGSLALNLAGFGLHLVALRHLPLFLAQSGIASSLAVTAVLAGQVFHTRLTGRDWGAVAAVCVGLALLAASAGSAGNGTVLGRSSSGLFVALAVTAAAGIGALQLHGAVRTSLTGLVAGLGFAVVSIAARLLPDLAPLTVLRAPAAYALALSGILAFVFYSLALQGGSVMTGTAPMIFAQTVTPSAVGVLLLGDSVRSGWWAGAIAGFLLAGVGATALGRFEGVRAE